MATRRNAEDKDFKRVPVSGNRDILNVKGQEEGFVYRWVNDQDDRITKFEAAGYEHVDHDVVIGTTSTKQASQVGKTVTKNVGKGTTAHLMRIKKEWYEEDQAAKQRSVNETEAAMKQQLNSGNDGTYGKVEIK